MSIEEEMQRRFEADSASKKLDDVVQDIVQAIYAYKEFDDFSDIPDSLRTQEGVYNWLFMKNAPVGSEGKGMIDYFRQIPAELLSDKAMEVAIANDILILSEINPVTAKDYLALCIFGYQRNTLAAVFIHNDFRTAETVEAMINVGLPQSFARCHADNPWMARVMTPELIDKAAISSLPFMLSLPESQVSDAALKAHLSAGYSGYEDLREAKKLKLAARIMKTGVWPRAIQLEKEVPRGIPKDLTHSLLMAVKHELYPACQALYMAYMMTHPIEDVVACMKTRQEIALGLEMYSDTELRPLIKANRHFKAAMLEESLGL
jgi:hypothetical protein